METVETVTRLPVGDTRKIVGSIGEIDATVKDNVEYKTIDGFKPGQAIRIGSVMAGDMIEWAEGNETARKTSSLRLIAKSLVDQDGFRYAAEKEKTGEVLNALRKIPHKTIERIVAEILELNGMNKNLDPKLKATLLMYVGRIEAGDPDGVKELRDFVEGKSKND